MIKTQPLLTIDDCMMNPQNIYVFGDNLTGKGTAGQAIIRGCPNAFGVPTKRKPSMSKDAFFSDQEDEYKIVKEKLIKLWNFHLQGRTIILPTNKIGSGLAKIEHYSSKIASLIDRFYSRIEA